MIQVRWHGRGGEGCFTVARLLGLSASIFEKKYALAFPSFGPERRGAPVLGFTKIDDKKILDRSEVKECDYIIVLNETLINPNIVSGLKKGGTILINSCNPERYQELADYNVVSLDATSLALEILGKPITNTAMLGAFIAISEIVSLDSAIKAIENEMKKSIVQKNILLLKKSYELMKGAKLNG